MSGCLWEFETLMSDDTGRPRWEWFEDMFGQLPEPQHRDACTVTFSWFTSIFEMLLDDAIEELVVRHTWAYIMMMMSTVLFGDKSAAIVHLRWLPFGVLHLLQGYTGICAKHLAGKWFRWWAHYSSCRAGYFGVFLCLGRMDLTILSFPWHPGSRVRLAVIKSGHRGGRCPSVDMACGSQGPLDIDSATHLLLRHRVAPGGSSDPAVQRGKERSTSSTQH
ncbi:hypothetical protein PIB30_024463 [Stylosanthes scabra]|uniref:Aminotransferase-like plant mobile domain-containing protein n=1 Tax=Stylosanthes scabra TaxID=79078 RepID=A0ABU6X817_9FABA|nr:hypothetical protein [Stylosanthes scabra]